MVVDIILVVSRWMLWYGCIKVAWLYVYVRMDTTWLSRMWHWLCSDESRICQHVLGHCSAPACHQHVGLCVLQSRRVAFMGWQSIEWHYGCDDCIAISTGLTLDHFAWVIVSGWRLLCYFTCAFCANCLRKLCDCKDFGVDLCLKTNKYYMKYQF